MKKVILTIAMAAGITSASSYWFASNGEYQWGPFARYSQCTEYLSVLRSQGFYGVTCVYR